METSFITGIYNYCDRWCERCDFRNRCRIYEDERRISHQEKEITDEAFWQQMTDNVATALEMISEAAVAHGLDLEKLLTDEEIAAVDAEIEKAEQEIRETSLMQDCGQYSVITTPFLGRVFSVGLEAESKALTKMVEVGADTPENARHRMDTLTESAAVIQWYLFFIEAKLYRALKAKYSSFETDDLKDSDGSAKTAVIAAERSKEAWAQWLKLMPQEEDTALQALALLSKIIKEALKHFPTAMSFVRPGFDE